jgi:hypothetical protein
LPTVGADYNDGWLPALEILQCIASAARDVAFLGTAAFHTSSTRHRTVRRRSSHHQRGRRRLAGRPPAWILLTSRSVIGPHVVLVGGLPPRPSPSGGPGRERSLPCSRFPLSRRAAACAPPSSSASRWDSGVRTVGKNPVVAHDVTPDGRRSPWSRLPRPAHARESTASSRPARPTWRNYMAWMGSAPEDAA